MADTTALKNRIRAAIKSNDNQEITGPVLQQALLDMVDELNGATETEASARQNGDNTLQQNINTEAQQRQNADSTLSGMINSEAQRAQGIEQNLQQAINTQGSNSRCSWIVNGKAFENRPPYECADYPNYSYILLSAYKKVYLKTIPYNIIEFSDFPDCNGNSNSDIFVAQHTSLSAEDFETEKGGFISFGLNSGTKYVVLVYLQHTSQSELDFYSALQPICQSLQAEMVVETQQRQNADSTLQQNINTEAQQRQNADSTLQQNINTEAQRAQGIEQNLQQAINTQGSNSRCCWIVNGKAFEDRSPWECTDSFPNMSYILLSAYKKVYLKTIPYNIIEFSDFPDCNGNSNSDIFVAQHTSLSAEDFETEKGGFISFGLNSGTKYVVLVYLQHTSQSELDFYSALQPICQSLQADVQSLQADVQSLQAGVQGISGTGVLVKNKAFDNTQMRNVVSLNGWIYILFKKPISNRVYLKQKPVLVFEFSEYPNTDGTSNESIYLSMVNGNSLSQTDYGVYYYDIQNSGCQYVAIDFNSLYTAGDLGIISYQIKSADEYEDALNKKYGVESYVLNKAFDNNANANVIGLNIDYWRYLLLKRVSNYIYFKIQPKFIFEFSEYPNVDGTSNASILLNYQLTPITTTNEFGYYVYEIKDSACQYIGIDYVNNNCSLNELGVFCYFNDFLITKLNSDVENLKRKKEKRNFIQVFHSDFSEQESSWVNVGTDSTYTPWTIDTANKCAYPTHLGGYITSGDVRTLKSTLGLPRVYFYDQRRTTFDVVLYTDTVFNIHFYRGNNHNSGQRQSQYQIDCANGLLRIMKYIESGRNLTNETLVSQQIPFNIVNGRKYTVKCTKNDFTFSIELIDGITSESAVLTYTGWGGGSNMFYHGFSWEAGNTAPILSNFSIWELANPYVIELGDSITEGDGFDSNVYNPNTMNLYTRWAYRLNQILGNSYLCACTSANIQHVMQQFETELQYIKPKYAIITIGTNNPSMPAAEKYEYYQQMKTLCDQYGITLLLSHIPLSTWNGYKTMIEEANPYIDLIPGYHAKLDIAIAVNYDTSLGCDVNKTWDNGMHPNLVGANCFLERIKNDYSFLFE